MKNGSKNILGQGSGSWLSHLEFDGKLFWKLDYPYEKWVTPKELGLDDILLPSDSSNRLDLQALKIKDYDTAEKQKHEMEEVQRKDKKLRGAAEQRRNSNS